MTAVEQREQIIQDLADKLRTSPFQVEFIVKERPAGIKIIFEVTQEEMYAGLGRPSKKTAT